MAISKVTTGSITDSVAIDTDTLVVDGTNNRVGIGNSNPTYILKVGPVNSTETISVQSTDGGAETIMQSVSGSDSRMGSSLNTPLNLITNNVSRMTIDTSGRVTMPYQPMFSANRAGLGYVNNINSNIDFIPIVNQGNHWNTSTHTFTCPAAGKYWVSVFNLNYTAVNSGPSYIQINKNNGVVFSAYADSPSGTNYHSSSASGVLDCAANDTITFFSPSGVVYGDTYCGATVYLIG